MNKKNTIWYILGFAVLLFAFKKPKKLTSVQVPIPLPGSTPQNNLYSLPGTQIFDIDNNVLFTYDSSGSGMMIINIDNNAGFAFVQYDTDKFGYVNLKNVTKY